MRTRHGCLVKVQRRESGAKDGAQHSAPSRGAASALTADGRPASPRAPLSIRRTSRYCDFDMCPTPLRLSYHIITFVKGGSGGILDTVQTFLRSPFLVYINIFSYFTFCIIRNASYTVYILYTFYILCITYIMHSPHIHDIYCIFLHFHTSTIPLRFPIACRSYS